MAALSSADKLKLKLSKARVERWNRFILNPPKNFEVTASGKVKPVVRCESVAFAPGQDKPEEIIGPDLCEQINRLTDGHKVRTSAGKLTLVRRGDNFADYTDPDYSESHRDPAWKAGQPKIAKRRANSPFKKSRSSLSSFTVERI